MTHELKPKDLAWRCPKSWVPKTGTSAVKPATTIVAQDRAVEAIAFGLGIRSLGFNVFVTGMSGTGRLTTIKSFVERLAKGKGSPGRHLFRIQLSETGRALRPLPEGRSGRQAQKEHGRPRR